MSREPGESARERGDPGVEAELRRRIRAQGRITFAEYMEVALYLLGGGYYEAHAGIGRRGDFLTSPETHPVFGALVARLMARMWRELGKPRPFTIIEYGAGTGSLCRQIVEAAPGVDGRFAESLEYSIVERSAFLRALQQAKLIDLAERVGWAHPSKMGEPAVGCVLANEVVDALPVHRVRTVGGEVRELRRAGGGAVPGAGGAAVAAGAGGVLEGVGGAAAGGERGGDPPGGAGVAEGGGGAAGEGVRGDG